MQHHIEAQYPITFRSEDAQNLGDYLRRSSSVSLIGMKRVGISNFLRFFLNHPEVKQHYIGKENRLFVVVDLNNMVEKTLYAFWMLTLKRLVDTIEESTLPDSIKNLGSHAFTQSIQHRDIFFTLETIRKLLSSVTNEETAVHFFFLRFDRLQEIITPEFFANIRGLQDSTKNVSYVLTSYRPLYELVPAVFTRSDLSLFLHEVYLKPATPADIQIILSTFSDRYDQQLSQEVITELLRLANGHVQYLHLSLLKLRSEKECPPVEKLKDFLAEDEEIRFLSEELYTSLAPEEQYVLQNPHLHQESKYLWETGFLIDEKKPRVFNPLFEMYLAEIAEQEKASEGDFTKKEHVLYSLLKEHEGELVERDTIIETVWEDEVELGISDWSIDRLVSRVRSKLKAQKSEYKIVTVITRGYKLVKK